MDLNRPRPGATLGLTLAVALVTAACLPIGGVNASQLRTPADAAEAGLAPLRTLDFLGEIAPLAAAASGVLAGIANLGVVANNPYLYSPPWYGYGYGYRPNPLYAPGYGYGYPYIYRGVPVEGLIP